MIGLLVLRQSTVSPYTTSVWLSLLYSDNKVLLCVILLSHSYHWLLCRVTHHYHVCVCV